MLLHRERHTHIAFWCARPLNKDEGDEEDEEDEEEEEERKEEGKKAYSTLKDCSFYFPSIDIYI